MYRSGHLGQERKAFLELTPSEVDLSTVLEHDLVHSEVGRDCTTGTYSDCCVQLILGVICLPHLQSYNVFCAPFSGQVYVSKFPLPKRLSNVKIAQLPPSQLLGLKR